MLTRSSIVLSKKSGSEIFSLLFVLFSLLPRFAAAQDVFAFMDTVIDWLLMLIPVLMSLAVVYFLWGLVKFIKNAADEKQHEDGKNIMVWGMIALFVMTAIWGIIGYLQYSLGFQDVQDPGDAPHLPGGSLDFFG